MNEAVRKRAELSETEEDQVECLVTLSAGTRDCTDCFSNAKQITMSVYISHYVVDGKIATATVYRLPGVGNLRHGCQHWHRGG